MQHILYKDPNITIFQSAIYQMNSIVVHTNDVVLVVDPGFLPHEISAIRQYVDQIKGQRPVFLIFTHSDFDHIVGYNAFEADKVFMTEAMAQNPAKEDILHQVNVFDDRLYIKRPHAVSYPQGDFLVYRDGVQYRYGQTRMTFYLTPGHTADSMMIIVWQLGLCIAGDYLSDIEFPFIEFSSVAYENTLEKLPQIHDRNWFTKLIPGHGTPALGINEWLKRRTESLAYLYALKESISTGIPFDESSLWTRYDFPEYQREFHESNLRLMKKEFDEGLWTWEPVLAGSGEKEKNAQEDHPNEYGDNGDEDE